MTAAAVDEGAFRVTVDTSKLPFSYLFTLLPPRLM